jgi:hypothetical protein
MKRASRQTSALSSDNRRTSSGNIACLKATTDVPSVKFVPDRAERVESCRYFAYGWPEISVKAR